MVGGFGGGQNAVAAMASVKSGLVVRRVFTRPGSDPFDDFAWERRKVAIVGHSGAAIFEQEDVEVPATWSQLASNVVAYKYFRGALGSSERESSVRALILRVIDTIAKWGREGGYFASESDAEAFHAELGFLLLDQRMSFNSPVWFNVGSQPRPQCSACFINSVEDTMDSVLALATTEGQLFKHGSGAGCNLSSLRSSREPLSGGGEAAGPVGFMRGLDAMAGAVRGGKTRKAAKMVILNADHPDIVKFVESKACEEEKAWALIDAGYDGGFDVEDGAYASVAFQNANHSVRVTDDFMRAVEMGLSWQTRAVTDGSVIDELPARDLMVKIATAAHRCGDPGLQFDTTINRFNPVKSTARINASNPCSEYMFIDDSACNLASLNLQKFQEEARFDIEGFKHAIEVTLLAQEILVDNAGYPTEKIAQNSHDFRPLGLGFANLGALLMSRGLPYDSDAGRAYAAAITALLSGHAYATSARFARDATGPFAGFEANRESFLDVIRLHLHSAQELSEPPSEPCIGAVARAAKDAWDTALRSGERHGYRNAQVTVLAPTGTIAFMMDCDTSGIEPDIALVKHKSLASGGRVTMVNRTAPLALSRLGYSEPAIAAINAHLQKTGDISSAPGFKEEHLAVFDCALAAPGCSRAIAPSGHVAMMAACQPFLSGAISKTVNLPAETSVEDIVELYLQAWRSGLKAIALYRDGCKRTQPLSTERDGGKIAEPLTARRQRMPEERLSVTHKFSIAGHSGYITVGLYEDGRPGEIFIRMAKEGSTLAGLLDSFGTAVSLALQHGVPLKLLCEKYRGTRFEPSGFTSNAQVPRASSVMDYIFRWLEARFVIPAEENPRSLELASVLLPTYGGAAGARARPEATGKYEVVSDAPPCDDCGAIMVRSGTCYSCLNCGASGGCS